MSFDLLDMALALLAGTMCLSLATGLAWMLCAAWRRLWPHRRMALIFKNSRSQVIRKVRPAQCGYVCKTGSHSDEYSILLADGSVRGFGEGELTWEPVTGWTPAELAQLSLPHRMIES